MSAQPRAATASSGPLIAVSYLAGLVASAGGWMYLRLWPGAAGDRSAWLSPATDTWQALCTGLVVGASMVLLLATVSRALAGPGEQGHADRLFIRSGIALGCGLLSFLAPFTIALAG